MFHHCQQHSAGGLGIGLGMVVVKLMTDVRRQSVEPVVWQVRPDAFGQAIRAKIIEPWTHQTEMVQGGLQHPDVELRIVRDHDAGPSQPCQKLRCNGGKLGGIQNIKMRQAVTFSEVFPKPAMPSWGPHQPIADFREVAILEDSHPGGANTGAGVVGRFKVYACDNHGVSGE